MLNYSRPNRRQDRYQSSGERLFETQFRNGFDGRIVDVDNKKDIKMIIQKHTNPLNEGLLDKKAKFLNSNGDFFHMGNVISVSEEGCNYLAVTQPDNKVTYSEYRIRPLVDDIKLIESDQEISLEGILASGLLYKDKSYTNQQNVFEDNEMKAIVVQYNDTSKNISLFDGIKVNGRNYRVAKIDNETLKEYDKEFGILQMVVFLTPNTTKLEKLNVIEDTITEFKGIVKYARVKDRKLNSASRDLLCEYQTVKAGDYIRYTFDCDDNASLQSENYIVFNIPSKYDGYDTSLIYRCVNSFKMLDKDGDIKSIPYYFEDNRTRIDKTTNNDNYQNFNSSYMIIMQENEVTHRFVNRKIGRVILKGFPYRITGVNNLDEGLLYLGLEVDEIDNTDDLYEVANYNSQISLIKPIIEDTYIDGEDRIFKGHLWSYSLSNVPDSQYYTMWEVNHNCIDIVEFDDKSCVLQISSKYGMGDTFVLTANINSHKIIKRITLE